MAFSDREYGRRLSFAETNNSLITLIAINLVVFVILIFIRAVIHLQHRESAQALLVFDQHVLSWFALPADLSKMGSRPWTVLTHMFTHTGVWHILGNMLWLWVFGYILQELTGNRKIVPVYLYGGLAGALAFLLAFQFLPALQPHLSQATAIGASAGVMAVAAAVTTLSPGYRIFPLLNGGIPIWVITIFYLIIDLATIPAGNPGGHIAHLAGALAGFLFIYFFRRGTDWGGWMNNFFDWVSNLFNPDKPQKGKSVKEAFFYKPTQQPYKKTPNLTEKRIDEILDKINQQGFDALTEEEKELLKRAAKED